MDVHLLLEDIVADYEEDGVGEDDKGDKAENAKGGSETVWTWSVMHIYLCKQLRDEIKNKTKILRQNQFLLNELTNRNFW